MATVVLTPAQVEALGQLHFIAIAFHIVEQDGTRTVAKVSLRLGCDSQATTELPAHHVGVGHIPVVVTHRSPNVFVEDLHATLAATVSIHHANG